MKLVIHPPVEPDRLQRIVGAAGPMRVVNAANGDAARNEIADADAFFGKITPELLAAAQHLRWVQAPTASLEHYVFPELVAHPCQLSNMRGLFSDVIADHVLGLVICFCRHLHTYIRQQATHTWEPVGGESQRSTFTSGPGVVSEIDRAHRHLGDLTMGIVGVGAIGQEIAKRASAFGMRVLGIDPQVTAVPGIIEHVWRPERLPELLSESDFVVIAAPHTPETYKLFRRSQFEQMRRTAILINIGRGAIVDLADLTSALQEGLIAGAGLDVYETEPLPKDHPLWDMPNAILTPHIAGAGSHVAERHLQTLLENIRRFTAGKPPLTLVDKSRWF